MHRPPSPVEAEQPRPALALPDRPAIAVLPFDNMSGDREQEYFSDGISEDIITALSKLRWFFVIARNSSFTYKGKAVHMRQVAAELGVRYVVEGSVRRSGDRVRITAQLNDTATGSHIWAEHYDRDLTDVFAVQDEITDAIVTAIEPQIYAAENFRSRRKPPNSVDAWDLVMRALSHHWRVTRPDSLAAQALLEQRDRDRSELRPGAGPVRDQPYVRRASGLGGSRDRGACRRACGAGGDRRRQRGRLGAYRARPASISPRAGSTMRWPSSSWRSSSTRISRWRRGTTRLALCYSGRWTDAFAATQRAIRQSPRDPSSAIYYGVAAYAQFVGRNYQEAIALAREATRQRGDLTGAYRVLTVAAGMTGQIELARERACGVASDPAQYFAGLDLDAIALEA